MVHKTESVIPMHIRVTFELPSDTWGEKIYVVGEFNDWSTKETPFKQARDGTWRATVDVPCNRCYEFYYLIDGQKRTDFSTDRCIHHHKHKENSLLIGTLASLCPLAGRQIDGENL